MEVEILYHPSGALGIVKLDAGKSIQTRSPNGFLGWLIPKPRTSN